MTTETSQERILPDHASRGSSLDEPETRDFKRWKESWDEKILLVLMKRAGRKWEYIIKTFNRLGVRKGQTGWISMWQRAAHDIDILGRAAGADRESELDRLDDLMSHHSMVDAAWLDYECIWDRIAELMDGYKTEAKWTPEKVKYAWTHGVSSMFPHIVLRKRQFHHHVDISSGIWQLDSGRSWAAL